MLKRGYFKKVKKFFYPILGVIAGLFNGLFGSSGGIVAVEFLKKGGAEPKKAHATSISIILALSIVSAVTYHLKGQLDISSALPYIPGGLIGAIVGALFLKNIPNRLLRRIFGVVIIIAALRMLMK